VATKLTVACAVDTGLPAPGLQAALTARTSGADVAWDVTSTPKLPVGGIPSIVLCDAVSVGAVIRRWPECAVIAIVPAYDDGTAVIGALQAGAATCIRDANVAIAAAFIVAVARRGGLVAQDQPR
jgi:hypothetical protein